MIAIDLPGHGASPPPVGRSYSDLSLQDYVTSIAAALDRLREMGHSPRTIVGHSQGSVLVAMLQQRMLDQGTTIREMFGIVNAVLLTPTPPAGLPWLLVDSGAHLTIIGAFLLPNDPVLGDVVFIPGAAWPAIFFSNFAGQVAPGTPPVAVLDTFAFPEPLLSTLELTGTAPVPSRPQVEVGAFQDLGLATRVHGTVLSVIGFEQDILVRASEAAAVYDHLAGTTDQRRFAVVSGAGTVHDMLISDPRGLLEAVAGTVRF